MQVTCTTAILAVIPQPSLGVSPRLNLRFRGVLCMLPSSSIIQKVRSCKTFSWIASSSPESSPQFQNCSLQSGSRATFLRFSRDFARREYTTFGNPCASSMQKGGAAMAALGISPVTDQGQVPLFRKLLAGLVKPYLNKNPTAAAALQLIGKQDPGPICYDHFAFRTFGTDGCGIDAIAQVFLDMGYNTRDELKFPGKKLRALWFSPPENLYDMEGQFENGPLPRIFISELLVDQLSRESQVLLPNGYDRRCRMSRKIIHKYTKSAGLLAKHAITASVLDTLTWPTPSLVDYQQLASESEYAAWTLVHGYALNHATVSVHRLHQMRKIGHLNKFLQDQNIKLNSEGGILKVSPDGGLQQSSSVADSIQYTFSDSEVRSVPVSYIEFAERLVLPDFSGLNDDEILEQHRRDGFEVGNADKIFESTSFDQTGVHRL